MTTKVTVIVEGREYVVEVGDLSQNPVRATVNQRDYQVQVPAAPAKKAEAAAPAAAVPQKVSAPAQPAAVQPAAVQPAAVSAGVKAITAPMPGDIVGVEVRVGDSVSAGDVVCVLEAMKMKNMIRTSTGGVVATVEVSPGQAVDYGAVLVTFE